MSRLDMLIAKLCPNGVIYKKLKDITEYSRDRINATEVDSHTYVGVDNLLQNKRGKTDSDYVPEEGRLVRFIKGDILIGNIRPYLKKIWLAGYSGGTNGDVLVIHGIEKELLPEYLYYCLSSDQFFNYNMKFSKGTKMPRGDKFAIMEYAIPVPPLEVQHEIVRVLDRFKGFTEELTTELKAELTARKQQYEYYRNVLLTFESDVQVFTIAEVADTNIGLATSVTKYKTEEGVQLLHNSDIQQNRIVVKKLEYVSEEFAKKNKKKVLHRDDIITVHTGDVGTSAVINKEFDGAIGFTTITTRVRDKLIINPQYLCNYLNSQLCKNQIALMTISDRNNLNQSSFEKILVPIPSMERQIEINNSLAVLDTLSEGITDRLPAEIEARQKQYEYYRDALLTIKEA